MMNKFLLQSHIIILYTQLFIFIFGYLVQLSDDMFTSSRHSHCTCAFSFPGFTSSSVFTESYLKNKMIDKMLTIASYLTIYFYISNLHFIYLDEKNVETSTDVIESFIEWFLMRGYLTGFKLLV